MTNKPMLSVERELLESFAEYVADSPNAIMRARAKELRAILDKEVDGDSHKPKSQDEPIYQVMYLGDGGGGWSDAEKASYDAKVPYPKHWMTRIVYTEQPAPVADHTQCEECKGWGYHENHHEGGGTECGECGGSGNAPVAVVMPERMDPRDPYDSEANQWNACLDEVARLNGVKP